MPWLALQAELDAAEAESWSDALLAAGALSVDLSDAHADTPQEQALFDEPGENLATAWPYTRLTALFEEDTDLPELMLALARERNVALDYRIAHVPEQDWVRATQQQFGPIAISDCLYVVPSWHASPRPEAINLMVDPGLAFGTGSHPTTRLCLLWLEEHLRGGETVIDYGCGSGILAIAAAKLGARDVLGVDIDPQAIAASRENARRNEVQAEFSLASAPLSR